MHSICCESNSNARNMVRKHWWIDTDNNHNKIKLRRGENILNSVET